MKILIGFILGWMIFLSQEDHKLKIFLAGDSTMSVKETKAYPETGWGMPFVHFWDTSVTIVNRAKNGRSTRTFITEGLWESIMKEAKKGDYVFIQFGHNDESLEKKERYSPPDSFKLNLTKFIREARSTGAIPVLLTPVSRRKFDTGGHALETHVPYSALVREVAKKEGVVLFDMDEKSRQLYQSFGEEHSRLLFLQLKAGEHPNYPAGKIDNTHFNELGARLIAQAVLEEIRIKLPDLSTRIIKPIVK